jgi:hypothetical protein
VDHLFTREGQVYWSDCITSSINQRLFE